MKDRVKKRWLIPVFVLFIASLFVLFAPTPPAVGGGAIGLFIVSNLFLILISLFSISFLIALVLAVAQRMRDIRKTEEKEEKKESVGETTGVAPVVMTPAVEVPQKKAYSTPGWVKGLVKVLLVLTALGFVIFSGLGETIINAIDTRLHNAPMPKGLSVPGAYPGWLWLTIIAGVLLVMLRGYVHEALLIFLVLVIVAFVI